jgi:hypothetical protein
MKDYQYLLDNSDLVYHLSFSTRFESEDPDPSKVERFCQKYWVDLESYETMWHPIQNQIFSGRGEYIPKNVFRDGFKIVIQEGASSFDESLLMSIKEVMKSLGNSQPTPSR